MPTVAVHQPNFLPWLGYFRKIVRADAFVLLDDVQFPKKGGTWINRVKIIVGDRSQWLTVPVDRSYHGLRRINEMTVDDTRPWRKKLSATIRASYGRAPFFQSVMPVMESILSEDTHLICELNRRGVLTLADALGIGRGHIRLSSELNASGTSTERLISIARALGADTYLSGDGAGGYQDESKFAEAGIGLEFQNYRHPTYTQFNTKTFIPGLSIVDALMNSGFEGVRGLLNPGEGKHLRP